LDDQVSAKTFSLRTDLP